MEYGFGVDLGGTTVKLACFTRDGVLLDKWELPTVTTDGGRHILPDIAASIGAYRAKRGSEHCLGIGIGVPGPVSKQGIVNRCINLGWGVFNIQNTLQQLTGLPIRAGNDASVAALGEYWNGSGQGCGSMVLVTLGTGVGSGIVLDGQLFHGAHGAAGEAGHMVLNPQETQLCSCGKRGCAEQYCSATGIVRLAKQQLASTDAPSCLRSLGELTCKDIFEAGKAGDAVASGILKEFYRLLGMFLANIGCMLDPETIVIGGGVSKAGQMLIDGVAPWFQHYVFHACSQTQLALASLGNDAGIYGAFRLICPM